MTREPLLVLGTLCVALIVASGPVSAADDLKHGNAEGSTLGVKFGHDPNAPCVRFYVNDRLTFSDLHLNHNAPSGQPQMLSIHFTVELYAWINGARGPLLDGKSETLNAPAGATVSNTLEVSAIYQGWNGQISCGTFEVYRKALVDGIAYTDDVVY